MNSKSKLVRGDYEDYLVRVYFGPRFTPSQDFLGACIDRAYLDFNRTLRGLSKFDASRALRKSAASMVKKALGALETACAHGISAAEFDNWHRCACEGLIRNTLTVGTRGSMLVRHRSGSTCPSNTFPSWENSGSVDSVKLISSATHLLIRSSSISLRTSTAS